MKKEITEFYMARSEYVLFLRWEGEWFKQIGVRLGVTPVRARQIYLRQLCLLKHKMWRVYGGIDKNADED